MIPSRLFFDLVDAGVAFKVESERFPPTLSVSAARHGLITVRWAAERAEGIASDLLPLINGYLWTDDAPSVIDPEFDPCLNDGDCRTFTVTPARGSRIAPTVVQCDVLVGGDDETAEGDIIFQVSEDGRERLVTARFDPDAQGRVIEGPGLSHRSLPYEEHVRISMGAETALTARIQAEFEATYGRDVYEQEVRKRLPADRAERFFALEEAGRAYERNRAAAAPTP